MKLLNKLLVIVALIGAVIFMVNQKKGQGCACGGGVCSAFAADESSVVTPVKQADKQKKTLPKLIDLGANQCRACQMMFPVLDELSKEYKGVLDVAFIDVWQPENQAKAKAFGIQSIPTQIFLDADGKELWRHVGYIPKEDILKKWKELGFTFKAVPQKKAAQKSATAKNM